MHSFCVKYSEKEKYKTKLERPFSNKECPATDQTNVENLLENVSQKVIKRLKAFWVIYGRAVQAQTICEKHNIEATTSLNRLIALARKLP